MIIIPDEVQVDERELAATCRASDLRAEDYDLEQPQRRVSELARSLGVPCVDVLPEFRKQGRQGGLYIEKNTHWNARGHALAASLLGPVVEAELAKPGK
ncbi:hypothetical protein HY251_12040 [bacterium]|nr:hypothetical protein [bacterium]